MSNFIYLNNKNAVGFIVCGERDNKSKVMYIEEGYKDFNVKTSIEDNEELREIDNDLVSFIKTKYEMKILKCIEEKKAEIENLNIAFEFVKEVLNEKESEPKWQK